MEPQDQNQTQTTQHQAPGAYAPGHSRKFKIFLAILTLVLVGGGIIAGIMLTNKEAANQDSEATAPAAQVIIGSGSFTPGTIKVKKGQGVVWINQDDKPHMLTVGADSTSAEGLGSKEQINQGESYSYVFSKEGRFNYFDATDPMQFKGIVIVE